MGRNDGQGKEKVGRIWREEGGEVEDKSTTMTNEYHIIGGCSMYKYTDVVGNDSRSTDRQSGNNEE